MVVQSAFVEKPPHIDERRMRHISDKDLFAALDLARPGLHAVRAAVENGDWIAAYAAWSSYFAGRERPVPVINTAGLARYQREHAPHAVKTLLDSAAELHTVPVDFTDGAMGKSRLYGFHYFGWIVPLIDAYVVSGDERHAETFVRLFNQWYETRDEVRGEWQMDVIWYTLGLSIRTPIFSRAWHAFRHSSHLDVQTQGRLLKTVLGAARWLAEEHDVFRYGNWQHFGVTGLFELATFWPEFREAPAWAELAWERMLEHLELDVYPDGGHFERAPSYHTAVMDGYQKAAVAAELSGHERLQEHPRFHQMYRCLLQQCSPLGSSGNFNDSGPVDIGPHMVRGAVLFGDPTFKWLAGKLGSREEIDLTLASLPDLDDGQTAADVYAALPVQEPEADSALLTTSKFAFMRGGWNRDDLFMAINYGPYIEHELESHSHFDALSFTCTGFGVPLAVEAGKPINYDDPLYYDWYRVAPAHNMVVIDGDNPAPDFKDGDLTQWSTSPVADLFQASHDGYLPTKNVRHRRTILFVRNDYWVVHDELDQAGDEAHEFAWYLYMPNEFTVDGGGVVPESGAGLVVLPAVTPAEVRVDEVQGMMEVPGPHAWRGVCDRREVGGVRFVQESADPRTTFFNVLYPIRDSERASRLSVQALPVSGEHGEACRLTSAEGSDLLVIGAGATTALRQAGGWSSDGSVWLVRSTGAWSAYRVGCLLEGDLPVFTASTPVQAISVWPDGEDLVGEIVTKRKTRVRLRAGEGWTHVVLNGVRVPNEGEDREPAFQMPAAGRYVFRVIRGSA